MSFFYTAHTLKGILRYFRRLDVLREKDLNTLQVDAYFFETESFKTFRYVRTKAKQKGKQIACEHPPSPLRKHTKRGSSDFSEEGGWGCCTQASKQIDLNGVGEG